MGVNKVMMSLQNGHMYNFIGKHIGNNRNGQSVQLTSVIKLISSPLFPVLIVSSSVPIVIPPLVLVVIAIIVLATFV